MLFTDNTVTVISDEVSVSRGQTREERAHYSLQMATAAFSRPSAIGEAGQCLALLPLLYSEKVSDGHLSVSRDNTATQAL